MFFLYDYNFRLNDHVNYIFSIGGFDKFCEQYNLKSIETSCLKNTNVDETFNFLIEKIIKENNYKNSYGSFSIINKTKAKKCCF